MKNYSFRGETPISYKSSLERDFLILQDFRTSVLSIVAQPYQIRFADNNRRCRIYSPPFLVYERLGSIPYSFNCCRYPKPRLIEIKPRSQWRKYWRQWLPEWKAAYRYAKKIGCEFHVYDESRIRHSSLANIRFLEQYKRLNFPSAETAQILETVKQMGLSRFDYLIARHFSGFETEGFSHLWHLLATRRLDCEISRPLDLFTELWIPTNER